MKYNKEARYLYLLDDWFYRNYDTDDGKPSKEYKERRLREHMLDFNYTMSLINAQYDGDDIIGLRD